MVAAVAVAVAAVLTGLGSGSGERTTSPSTAPPTVGIELDDSPVPRPGPPPEPILPGSDTRLLVVEGSRLVRIDLPTGAVEFVSDGRLAGGTDHQPLAVGPDRLVIVKQLAAYSVDDDLATLPVRLGDANAVVPSWFGSVWLVDLRRDRAVLTDVVGEGAPLAVPLPDGSWTPYGVTRGVLLTTEGRWVVVDRAGDVDHEERGQAVATHGDLVAWVDPDCTDRCLLHVTDLRAGADRTLALASRPSVEVHDAQFDPDGERLAVAGDLLGPERDYEVMLVDLSQPTLDARLLWDRRRTPAGVLSWSPDSRWLFWSFRTLGGSRSVIVARDITSSRGGTLDLPATDVLTFVAF